MEPTSIGILIVALLLIVEVVVMLLKLKVDKMLLLMPLIGVLFAVISFALNEYQDMFLSSLSGSTPYIVIYSILVVGVIFGLFALVVWFKGEKEARKLTSAAKSIDSAIAGIESDIQGSGMEIEHFEEEMGSIKAKVEDYETKEKGV
jgi:H+/Cl- antiporter ClcA